MRPAIALWDIVGETQCVFMERVGPSQRQFNRNIVTFSGGGNGWMDRVTRPVQIIDKGAKAAIKVKLRDGRITTARVAQPDTHPAVQKCQLAEPMLKRGKIKIDMRKNLQ